MDWKSCRHGLFTAALLGAVFTSGGKVLAAEQEESTELPGAGVESVITAYQASGEAVPIENYLVPSIKGEYLNMGFADVDEGSFLYIRSGPTKESEWIGKLYRDYAAKIAGPVGEWTKIESGNVTGYVKTEFLLTGEAAQQKAEALLEAAKASRGDNGAEADQTADSRTAAAQTVDTQTEDSQEESSSDDAAETNAPVINAPTAARAQENVIEETGKSDKEKKELEALAFDYAESKEEEAKRAAEEEAARQKEAEEAVQAYVSSGQAVVDYACQFLGNPYVWGGTSLTNGADCSGFVQSVYANFGVSMPRTSGEMRYAGREVSYDQALPGDVICYEGHVGIYMGNGQIVNAIDDSHGIGISNAAFTNIITVRRLL